MALAVERGVVRFGPFRIDLKTQRLYRGQIWIKLPRQSFLILQMLLTRPGEVVTRDELQRALWPSDTFVDFDHGLNNAVNRIRLALNDRTESPTYIETLPKVGYRFVGSVQVADNGTASEAASTKESASATATPEPALAVPAPQQWWKAKEQTPAISARKWTTALFAATAAKDSGVQKAKQILDDCATAATPLGYGAVARKTKSVVIAILALVVATTAWWLDRNRVHRNTARPPIRSVAVLPFKNLSGDPSQEYLADGMTEELIGRLSGIRDLRVISRTSVMGFKDTKLTLPQIAKSLNVDALVEGSVIREGHRIRVHAQLIRAATDEHFWSEEYDRQLQDVLALQSDVAQAIAEKVMVTVPGQEHSQLVAARPVPPEAYESYLKGRYLLGLAVSHFSRLDTRQYGESDIQAALGYFKSAIENDSAYALAYAGLADAYLLLGHPVWGGHSPKETLSDAKAAASKALELDPSLAEAHFSLAQTLEYDWNWSEAEKEYRLALQLNPNYGDAHCQYGRFVQALGRNDEAMTQMNYAMEVDPFGIGTRVCMAYVTYASRQYDLAVEQFERLGDDWGLVWAYREKKMYSEAIAAWERWKAGHQLWYRSPHPVATIAGIYGLEGRKREAEELIDELKETARHQHISGFFFAEAYLGLGQKDQAVTWLERAYEDHDQWMVFANSYPGLDALRSEPRFEALMRRMNFPQ